ncbi:MAG: YfcE family phosphodiesterase [Akkermansia sp.]
MRIGVISDIHDRLDHLQLVMEELREADCEAIICLGDICAPFTLLALLEHSEHLPIHLVFGNNDGDIFLLSQIASHHDRVTLHGQFGQTVIAGLRIAMTHYPAIATPLAKSGDYDVILYGHNHTAASTIVGHCILGNPGEIMGRLGTIGYGILDTDIPDFSLHTLCFSSR